MSGGHRTLGRYPPNPLAQLAQCKENSAEMDKVLLLDLENCPNQIHELKASLEQFSQVVICYAQTGAKIPLDWLVPLSATVNSNKLKIFKMEVGGKNAADFGICFFAGVLMQQLNSDTHFVIVSNDTDLDHVVRLLKSQGRSAERIGTQKSEKKHKSSSAIAPALQPSIKLYCTHLITYRRNRPKRQDTLLNSIKNKFKDSSQSAPDVFKLLKAQGAVKILDSKVTYNDQKIKELATQ